MSLKGSQAIEGAEKLLLLTATMSGIHPLWKPKRRVDFGQGVKICGRTSPSGRDCEPADMVCGGCSVRLASQ